MDLQDPPAFPEEEEVSYCGPGNRLQLTPSAFFADMAEIATSSDKPSEPMDLDIDRNAMEKYAEYIYGTSHYPTHMRIVTGKGDPEKMFKALATFEKLQDEKLVVRIKADIVTEYRKNTEKAASFMCLALSTSRPEMAADMMLYIPAADSDQTKTVFDMAKISPKTADVSKSIRDIFRP